MNIYQHYNLTLKVQLVLKILQEKKTIERIVLKHGVSPNQLRQWKTKMLEDLFNLLNNEGNDKVLGFAIDSFADGEIPSEIYAQLYTEVNLVADAFQLCGIQANEVINLCLPYIRERIIAKLACAQLGVMCVPIPIEQVNETQFTTSLQASKAKVLIIADWCMVNSQFFPIKTIADRATINAPELDYLIVVRHLGRSVSWLDGRDIWWDMILDGEI